MVKYMGSKSRIAKHIVPIIQRYIDQSGADMYIEPFVGGANVIDKVQCKWRVGGDLNRYVIALFWHLQQGGTLPETITREEYNRVRANKSGYPDWYVGCVGFLSSYNGRFFDGGFAPAGQHGASYRDYYREARENLLRQVEKLEKIIFLCTDYRDHDSNTIRSYANTRRVIYCDPPYISTKQYANSRDFDHAQFWEVMRRWSADSIVLISEQTAPPDFAPVWEGSVIRTNDNASRITAKEKLFQYAKITKEKTCAGNRAQGEVEKGMRGHEQ